MDKKFSTTMRNVILTGGTILMFVVIIYASFTTEKNYTNLSVREVHERIESSDTNYVLIDVRTEYEYSGELGHLEDAVLFPMQNLDVQYHELEEYQNAGKDLILYCRSGNRSRRAAQFLVNHGLTNVYNMEGGMRMWNIEYGRPAESDNSPPNLP